MSLPILFSVHMKMLPYLQAGWLQEDLGPNLPRGLEVRLPVTRCPSAGLAIKSSLGSSRKCVQTSWCGQDSLRLQRTRVAFSPVVPLIAVIMDLLMRRTTGEG